MDDNFSEMIEESAKGSLILILGKMISTLIGALGVIIVARILGSTSYGLISIAIIPINLALLLINNGVSNALTNFIAEDRITNNGENIRTIILSGYIINVTIGIITSLVLYLSSEYLAISIFMRPELKELIKILSIITLSQALLKTSNSIILGFERMHFRNITDILYYLLKSIIGPVLVYLGYGPVGAAYGNSAPLFTAGILGVVFVILNVKNINSKDFNPSYFKPIINYSSPILASNLVSGAFMQILKFILPLYVSVSQMGNYAAAINFNVIIAFILTPVTEAMFPLLSKIQPNDSVIKTIYNNIIKYMTLVTFPIVAAVIALSNNMINILYGPNYQPSILYVQILMLNFLFIGLGSNITGILLKSQKRTDINFKTTIIYIIIGIPLGLILIPKYGILGFLATTILAPKLGLFYSIYWINKNLGITLDYPTIGKITLSTIVSYIACIITVRLVSLNLWIELILGGIVLMITYLISILITGAINEKNLYDIKRITEKNKLGKTLAGPILKVLIKIVNTHQKHT